MRRLLFFLLLATSTLAQSGGLTVWIPVPNRTFELGYGASMSQDLGLTPAQLQADPAHPGNPGYALDGVYILQFTVQNHNFDGATVYPGLAEVEVTFGTQKLCDAYAWGTSNPSTVTYACQSPKYLVNGNSLPGGGPAQGQHNLILMSTVNDGSANGGWPVKFNNVSLTFTPSD